MANECYFRNQGFKLLQDYVATKFEKRQLCLKLGIMMPLMDDVMANLDTDRTPALHEWDGAPGDGGQSASCSPSPRLQTPETESSPAAGRPLPAGGWRHLACPGRPTRSAGARDRERKTAVCLGRWKFWSAQDRGMWCAEVCEDSGWAETEVDCGGSNPSGVRSSAGPRHRPLQRHQHVSPRRAVRLERPRSGHRRDIRAARAAASGGGHHPVHQEPGAGRAATGAPPGGLVRGARASWSGEQWAAWRALWSPTLDNHMPCGDDGITVNMLRWTFPALGPHLTAGRKRHYHFWGQGQKKWPVSPLSPFLCTWNFYSVKFITVKMNYFSMQVSITMVLLSAGTLKV